MALMSCVCVWVCERVRVCECVCVCAWATLHCWHFCWHMMLVSDFFVSYSSCMFYALLSSVSFPSTPSPSAAVRLSLLWNIFMSFDSNVSQCLSNAFLSASQATSLPANQSACQSSSARQIHSDSQPSSHPVSQFSIQFSSSIQSGIVCGWARRATCLSRCCECLSVDYTFVFAAACHYLLYSLLLFLLLLLLLLLPRSCCRCCSCHLRCWQCAAWGSCLFAYELKTIHHLWACQVDFITNSTVVANWKV